jgi:hypothetical protein
MLYDKKKPRTVQYIYIKNKIYIGPGFLVKNLDLDSNLNNIKKLIKKVFKILKLTRTDPTPEPYRCAGLKLANKNYQTAPNPKRPYS